MGRSFWHLLLTLVLPAFITITLQQHTPQIIIGVGDVDFNSCSAPSCRHSTNYGHFDFFCLHAQSHNLIVHHHHPSSHTLAYNLLSAFPDSFNSFNTHVILTTIPQKQVFLLFSLSRICVSQHPLGLISVYMCTQHDAIII
jgi:hypothetical protein